jgi:hypothetical protein
VTAQATATVRIVSGQRVRFSDSKSDGDKSQPAPRKTRLETGAGEVPAVLVEFS